MRHTRRVPLPGIRHVLSATLAAAALIASTAASRAHPHVFAEARLDVVVNPDETVRSLRHVWRFDDVFTSTVLLEFDANGDQKLDDGELEEVSKTVFESLAEFNYFQLVSRDGKDVPMKPPAALMADLENEQLIILFESEPAEPLRLAGKVSFGIYDPTFYTAIEFIKDESMAVEPMPAGCARQVIRPDPDEAIAQNQDRLTDAFFDDPSGNDLSKIFATRLELTCQGKAP